MGKVLRPGGQKQVWGCCEEEADVGKESVALETGRLDHLSASMEPEDAIKTQR